MENITDCHFHIYGPFSQYPLSENPIFHPPEVSTNDYNQIKEAIGIQRGVIIQGIPQGFDNRRVIDAVAELGNFKAVVMVKPDVERKTLKEFHQRGVRGVRIVTAKPCGSSFEEIPSIAEKIADLGWNIQLYSKGEELERLENHIEGLKIPIVLDHMGYIQVGLGLKNENFKRLFQLFKKNENVWIKLTAPYRITKAAYPYSDVAPLVEKLISIDPNRLVWGSDWPHTSLEDQKMPNTQNLLPLLKTWAKYDEKILEKILVHNPEKLYGF